MYICEYNNYSYIYIYIIYIIVFLLVFVPIWAGMRLNSRIEFSYKIYRYFYYSVLSSFPRLYYYI